MVGVSTGEGTDAPLPLLGTVLLGDFLGEEPSFDASPEAAPQFRKALYLEIDLNAYVDSVLLPESFGKPIERSIETQVIDSRVPQVRRPRGVTILLLRRSDSK